MYYIMYVYDLPLLTLKFEFLEFFQKPPGGWWTTARRRISLCLFLGLWRGTACWHIPDRQATHPWPPGDTWLQPRFSEFLLNCLVVMNNRQVMQTTFGTILVFCVIWY